MDKPIIAENLKKNFGKIEALKGISFEVLKSEVFGLIGPNAAGKTTALRIIATLLRPTEGDVKVFGHSVLKEADKIRNLISYLPEEAGAYKNMSGLSYLSFMAAIFANDKKLKKRFVQKGIEIADLGRRIKDKVGTYSKGMVRKLLLARTVMINPQLAILDEPTSGLDVVNAMEIRNRIKGLVKEGMSVFLSSHNMLEVEYLSDRVAVINEGLIHEIGTPQELKTKYKASNLEEVFIKITQ